MHNGKRKIPKLELLMVKGIVLIYLDFNEYKEYTIFFTGRGAVWKRTCFGSRVSEVQILSPRPAISKD